MNNITELTAADLRTWDDVMAETDDSTVPPLPLLWWFLFAIKHEQSAKAAA